MRKAPGYENNKTDGPAKIKSRNEKKRNYAGKGMLNGKMTGGKKSYTEFYKVQRLQFFKRKIEKIRDRLLDDPWGFDFDAEILLLKNANIEEVELIGQAVRELCGEEINNPAASSALNF